VRLGNARLNLNKMEQMEREKTATEKIRDFIKKHPNLDTMQYEGGAFVVSGHHIICSVEEKHFSTKEEYLTALLILNTMPQLVGIYLEMQPK